MQKTAPAQYPILDVIADRWSPLAFASTPVEIEKLERIFEAARWAASSNNDQPWGFLIGATGTTAHNKMAECLVEGNSWAKNAPILALSVARTVFERNGKPNRHSFYDTGMATANMLVQATSEGLVVHQMAGYDVEKARTLLGLPEHHEPVALMAMGYYGDPAALDEKNRLREKSARERKPISGFVFQGDWGKDPL